MNAIIDYLKQKSVHTPRLAIVRFLLAFGLLLTVLSTNQSVMVNHHYKKIEGYMIRHDAARPAPFKKWDLFLMMNPETAKMVVIFILLLTMTGLLPQVTGPLFFWACFSLHNYYIINNGGDDLAFILSILLLPICLTDPRLNTWKGKVSGPRRGNITANIAMVIIQFQAAFLYFDASYSKLFHRQWYEGTAVYYYTSNYRLGAPDWLKHINELITLTPMVKALTWGSLALELLLAACFFFPARIKRKFIIPALLFHFLIVINFGLITFFISIAAMLLLYLDDEDYSVRVLLKRKG